MSTGDAVGAKGQRVMEWTDDAVDAGIGPPHSRSNLEPGFERIDGDLGNSMDYDNTTVDIIAVPCIDADPIATWMQKPSSSDSPKIPTQSNLSQAWVCHDIRTLTRQARILFYRHRPSSEGTTLEKAADDLIEQVLDKRQGPQKRRPIFFICHSIGGLVVKSALCKAWMQKKHKSLVDDFYGVTFFATPHHGSSRLATPKFARSIQRLLSLKKTLSWSISGELHGENELLLDLHRRFISLACEMRLWTFCETVESQGLEQRSDGLIASVKSSLIGSRTEQVFPLNSDHANCASFGDGNGEAMRSYLISLRKAVEKASWLSTEFEHTSLRLSAKVEVELINCYEDVDNALSDGVKLQSSKHNLDAFLKMKKGPDGYQSEQLMRPSHPTAGPQSLRDAHQRKRSLGATATEPISRPQQIAVPGESPPPRVIGKTPSVSVHQNSGGVGSGVSKGAAASPKGDFIGSSVGHTRRRSVDSPPDHDGHGGRSSHEGSKGIVRIKSNEELNGGFQSSSTTSRYMWIHLPFNNPYWVKLIFDKLSDTRKPDYSKILHSDQWTSKQVQGRRSNWHISYVKPGCALVPAETNPSSPNKSPNHFHLYLPYLHYDTYVHIVKRRDIIELRKKHGCARLVPKEIADLDSLESKIIWKFITHNDPLHTRRTLDQYGYPALQHTAARDEDQMLYKLTKPRAAGSQPKKTKSPQEPEAIEEEALKRKRPITNGNVLMVDQLWLWVVDTTTLLTSFPRRESGPNEGRLFQQADLRNSIYGELNEELKWRCKTALDLAALITLHAVTVLMDRSSHPDLEVFNIFDEELGILTENMTKALKDFRIQPHGKDHDFDSKDNGPKAIKERYQKEREQIEQQNRQHTSAVLELRDMDDELHTLINLFTEQQTTIESMKEIWITETTANKNRIFQLDGFTACGREFLDEALKRLEGYLKQANDMMTRIESTRKDYKKLQQMI